ncbi:hypothetical protein IDH11_01890 [Pelagibacterales bacterium SAG-MED30]|nr:hypothetical protein [Pelagibacterales bacterium SAG-MED30]
MSNIIIFLFTFYILLISVIGYGILFQKLCFGTFKDLKDQKAIYTGFYGLFLLTLISLITSLFLAHNFTHNILLHLIGVLSFIFLTVKNKKNYLKIIFLISLFTLSALLISKTHDDFSYYHFTFTKYLTEQKVIFGMGIIGHGYKLLSSLFFLNSTFYLPLIEYFSFHFTLLYFLIFFNFFLFKEIFSKNNHEATKFLYIFALAFFNLSFNRLAEFGTDKAAQILIVIIIIKMFQYTCFDKNKSKIYNILFLIPLLGYCISLKTYFLPYMLLGLIIFLLNEKFFKSLKIIFYSKSFFILFISLSIYFVHHFISTGCVISPLSITCFGENLYWADDSKTYEDISLWLEQWAKAGAGPDFRVEDPLQYIQNFNWVSHWIEKYFLGKFLEQLELLLAVFFIILLFFKNFKFKKEALILDKRIILFYLIILAIFFIWFTKTPTLRYGGYSIVFLTLSIPIALIYQKLKNKDFFEKKLKYLIILIIVLFNLKNINRIDKEFKRTDLYKFDNFPFFAIPEKKFISEAFPSGLTIYRTSGHCWNTPTPCIGHSGKINVNKNNGYYFIYR